MMIETVLKTILSKSELFLLRNQRKFVANLSSSESSESQNHDETEFTEEGQYYSQLLRGTVRKRIDEPVDPDLTQKLKVSNIQNG